MSKATGWILSLLLTLLLCGGCQSYNWRTDFEQAEQQAKAADRCMFVFYKYWLDQDSNRMLSNEVLSDPRVVAEFQDTINLLLDKDFPAFGTYVARYGVQEPPAAIIVAPSGSYQVRTGFVPKEQFIDFVRNAKAQSCPPTAQK